MEQRVLITAGASGIGREIAHAFSALGAKVFVCDIDTTTLALLKENLPDVSVHQCDMARREDIQGMVTAAVAALNGIDVLINNAGISGPTAPVEDIDPDDWDSVMQVNLNATFYTTRLVIPYLKKSPAGVIINMSSVAGRFGYANRSPYCTTKWGLIGFTKTLALELGAFGIRANAILPGAVDGPRLQAVFDGRAEISGLSLDEVKTAAMAHQSIKRLVDPRDIAALAVFLASDQAKSISGQSLSIDNDMQRAS